MRRQVIALSMVIVSTGSAPLPAALAQPSRSAVADSARRLDSLATALKVWDRPTPENQRRAVRLWSEAAALYRQVGDRRREADMLTQAGRGHSNRDTASVYLETALRIARETADTTAEGRALLWLGAMRVRVGELDSALTLTREAVRIARRVGDHWGESRAWAFYWVAHTYRLLAAHDSAEAYYREAIRVARATGARTPEAGSLGDIGNIYSNRGQYDSALVYNTAALNGFRAVGHRPFEAVWLMNIGAVHGDLGRQDSSLVYYQKSLTLAREVGHRGLEQVVLLNIGYNFMLASRPDSAADYFRQAVRLGRELGDKLTAAHSLANLAEAQHAIGQSDSALANVRTALTTLREAKARREEAGALATLAMLHASAGRGDSAVATHREALRVAREAEHRFSETASLRSLGDLYSRGPGRRDLATAVAYYDSAAAALAVTTSTAGADQNRVSLAETGGELFDRWVLAWLARADELGQDRSALAALAVAERGRAQALLDLLRRGHRSDSGASESQPEHRAGADLVQEGSDAARAAQAMGVPIVAYHATKDTLLTWLILPLGEVTVARQAISRDSVAQVVAAIRGHLGADEALGRSLRALEPAEVSPALVASSARSSGRTRGGATRYSSAALGASAAALVPPSLMRRLPAGGELVIVPHGPLGVVAFAALPVRNSSTGADSAEPLGARFAIRYAPSLTTLRLVSERANPVARTRGPRAEGLTRDALVVGNPAMPRVALASGASVRLPALPAAGREGQWVARALGVTALTGRAATERVVRARMGNAAVIHLATHGFAYSSDAKALDSFVALAADSVADGAANGLLTVGEVIDDLPRLTAELVVLSACQTGLGNLRQAEGTVGLQRAFLAKGAQTVLVSLWSVSDDATELLMRRFYTHWLHDADAPRKAEALRRAQADVRRTPGFADPRFWAAFQLVGAQ